MRATLLLTTALLCGASDLLAANLELDLDRTAGEVEILCESGRPDACLERARRFFDAHGKKELATLGPIDRRRLAEIYLDFAGALEDTGRIREAHGALAEGLGLVPLHPRMALMAARLSTVLGNGQTLGRVHPYFDRVPEIDEDWVNLMERARREDVVVPLDAPLFGDRAIEVGQWQSEIFIRRYGTALFLLEPWDGRRVPVVLVHGINDSPRSLAPLIPALRAGGYQPIVFFYPTGLSLDEAGRELDQRIAEWTRRHRVARVGLVGHSLGGLVAASMLGRGEARVTAVPIPAFVAIASPWAGFDAASGADWVPYRPPAWTDLSPDSAVLRRIQQREDRETATYLFFAARGGDAAFASGNDDGVVSLAAVMESPVTERARDVFGFYEDHMSILAAARMHHRLVGVLDAELRESKRAAVAG